MLHLCGSTNQLKQLTSQIVIHGVVEDGLHVVQLIRACFQLGAPELALNVFSSIEKPSLFLLNLMVKGLSDHGLHCNLLRLYKNCVESGIGSDNYTYPFVIKGCTSLCAVRTGEEIHCVVVKANFEDNLVVQTALVDMYAKCGRMRASQKVFDRMPDPDMVSCNALLYGYSFNGLDQEVFEAFRQFRMMWFAPNISTFVSLIPVCTNLGSLDLGKSVHCLAIKCGFSLDESLVPALISMYSAVEEVSFARELFDLLQEKNVIVWNAMISAYTQNKQPNKAFEVYRRMIQEGVQPNLVTFVSIIPSGDNLEDRCGESIHASVVKCGLEDQSSVVTALLSMYAKLRDMVTSQFLFDGIPEKKSILSWNSMMSAYIQNGLPDESLNRFCKMISTGISPDSISMINVISACTRLKDTQTGMSAHAYCLRNGLTNLNLSNTLLTFYCECDKLSTAIDLFSMMRIRNVVSWNTLISSCVHHGNINFVTELLHQMQYENVRFDLVTMISILPCYFERDGLLEGMAVHGHSIKTGFNTDVSLTNALISMYANCGDLYDCRVLFEGMQVRSVVSWNAILSGYRNYNLNQEVMVLFHQMIEEDQRPNSVTLLNTLPMCCSELQVKTIHAYAIRQGDLSEPPLLTSLICTYANFENLHLCQLLFEKADKRNVILWNAMMSAHLRNQNAEHVVALLREMLLLDQEPDHVTIVTLILACVQVNSFSLIQSIMAYIICKGFEKDILIRNALIDMYTRCGYISIARKIFDGMISKDIVSWSVMINGFAIHGDGKIALELFSQMKCSGVEPDDVTFISVLTACSHSGLVEEGRAVFNSMTEEYGIKPRMEHYACMVDLLGRTGHLSEAYELIKGLPFKPSESLLESALGACRIHGNFEIAEKIGSLLFDQDPKNSGSYVMLSNIYAAAGRWTDAIKVRSNMDDREVRKLLGFSTIEVDA
ncbi:hypothetical protein Sjap_001395 [Stephania japonica]|uniref:Pentatricopeptide repeat-containing protein n=1 Tax=Stephania japonica TaxID=461633 RepID=A0AAP0KME7_9MAGN